MKCSEFTGAAVKYYECCRLRRFGDRRRNQMLDRYLDSVGWKVKKIEWGQYAKNGGYND